MSNEWIKWEGGECPVDINSSVHVKFTNGADGCVTQAKNIRWQHEGSFSDIIAYRLDCQCDGCTDGDDEIPEFLKNDFKDEGLTDHKFDEPGDGIPDELAIEDIPPVLRPATETMTNKEDSMDDLERLARLISEPHEDEYFKYAFIVPEATNGFAWAAREWHRDEKIHYDKFIWDEIKAKRDELSGKPKEWVNNWARWRAQDNSGKWIECSGELLKNSTWLTTLNEKCETVSEGEVLGDWHDTLEERVMEGKITDVKTWDRALTPEEIKAVQDHELDSSEVVEWVPGDICTCDHTGRVVVVVYVLCEDVCVRGSRGLEVYNASNLDPIKTPKEKAIEEIMDIIASVTDPQECVENAISRIAKAVYDAGFKKWKS